VEKYKQGKPEVLGDRPEVFGDKPEVLGDKPLPVSFAPPYISQGLACD